MAPGCTMQTQQTWTPTSIWKAGAIQNCMKLQGPSDLDPWRIFCIFTLALLNWHLNQVSLLRQVMHGCWATCVGQLLHGRLCHKNVGIVKVNQPLHQALDLVIDLACILRVELHLPKVFCKAVHLDLSLAGKTRTMSLPKPEVKQSQKEQICLSMDLFCQPWG